MHDDNNTTTPPSPRSADLSAVKEFWEKTPCGEIFGDDAAEGSPAYFEHITRERYRWEYHLSAFLDEAAASGKDILEIGCGMGIDSSELARRGSRVTGIDLTDRAIALAKRNFARIGVTADLRTGNAEALEFRDNSFDAAYSFGVLHHTPDTPRAIAEIRRVLKPGGKAFIMLYSRYSLNHLAHAILGVPYEKSKEARGADAPVTRMYSKAELEVLFQNYTGCTFRKRYLFGAGWKPLAYVVPVALNDGLGRLLGWHWLIVATKPG